MTDAVSTLAIIVGIFILAVALGYSTAHRNVGHEAFVSILSNEGDSLIDTSCRIQTNKGQPYKLHTFSGLVAHPTRQNACFFRKMAGGGMINAVSECNLGSPIHDHVVTTHMGVEPVMGADRCVVDFKGLGSSLRLMQTTI